MTTTIANFENKLLVKTNQSDIESLPGAKYDRKNNMVVFPMEYRTYHLIKKVDPKATETQSVRAWVTKVQQVRALRERIKAQP